MKRRTARLIYSSMMIWYFCAFAILLSTAFGYPSATNDKKCLNYCSNDGVCVIVENAPRCYCLPEWEGETCEYVRETTYEEEQQPQEISIMSRSNLRNDPCSLVPGLCKNGFCQLKDNKYICVCPYDFTGTRCELKSPCVDFCQNGGICTLINNGTDPSCNCNGTGFRGDSCQRAETPTTTKPPVTTADSKCAPLADICGSFGCRIDNGRPVCNCPPGTIPPFCDPSPTNPASSASSRPTNSPGQPSSTGPTNSPGQPSSTGPTNSPGQASSTGPTNSPGQPSTAGTPQPGKTCANNPCKNSRPCYNTGNSYFCYCGSRYTGYDCEKDV